MTDGLSYCLLAFVSFSRARGPLIAEFYLVVRQGAETPAAGILEFGSFD